jgi:predicted ATPase
MLAIAHADSGQFDDAWRCIGKAMTAMQAPERDVAKAQAYFEHSLTIARAQRAKSWELRAAMSMARLWRDQGRRDEARDLLAPIYSWFTEGFDTLDLKEAKTLLDTLRHETIQ